LFGAVAAESSTLSLVIAQPRRGIGILSFLFHFAGRPDDVSLFALLRSGNARDLRWIFSVEVPQSLVNSLPIPVQVRYGLAGAAVVEIA
jgi:hypothetical protein